MTADTLVKTQSCYAAILDEASPSNRHGFFLDELQAGKHKAREGGQDECLGLFHFNDQLIDSAGRGELLSWTLLFDGVFRATAKLLPNSAAMQLTPQDNLGSPALVADLICPTGRLIVTCLGSFGEPHLPFLVVEPGTYRISLSRDASAEHDHLFLEDASEYPVGGGPDWLFVVQRVG